MSETVKYFGYGANRDARMIGAIVGKQTTELQGEPAILQNYRLAVQRLDQIPADVRPDAPTPRSPRAILRESWGDDFTSYVILRWPGESVAGTIWDLTPEERERVRDWELLDFGWYVDCEGTAIIPEDGWEVSVVTECIPSDQEVDHMVDGLDYETWLHDPKLFEAIADQGRRDYDIRQQGH